MGGNPFVPKKSQLCERWSVAGEYRRWPTVFINPDRSDWIRHDNEIWMANPKNQRYIGSSLLTPQRIAGTWKSGISLLNQDVSLAQTKNILHLVTLRSQSSDPDDTTTYHGCVLIIHYERTLHEVHRKRQIFVIPMVRHLRNSRHARFQTPPSRPFHSLSLYIYIRLLWLLLIFLLLYIDVEIEISRYLDI